MKSRRMNRLIKNILENMHGQRKMVLLLSCIVVFTTTYLLILPAFTLDAEEAAEQGGIDLSAAIRMFLKRSIAEGGFPFSAKIDENTLKAIIAIDNIRTTSEKNGNSSMTLEEINEEIMKTREERKTKRKNS